ncbi:hypothetical protein AB0M79_25045 [Polymorphospora sp. NPDC051019]|uniref:hypothetical protein n=1 Tax=Polymorphospora sp. NPDC051019 TaxID=3155725 RepID=UPI0034447BDA
MEPATLLPTQDPPGPGDARHPAPRSGAGTVRIPRRRRPVRLRTTLAAAVPDEPLAVVVAGPSGHGAVLGALLGGAVPLSRPSGDAFLVVGHAAEPAVVAHLPGRREPQPYAPDGLRTRPPRRIEVSLPDPLLRHFTLVDAPDTDDLDAAGTRLLLDVAARGALLFVLPAARQPDRPEIALLAGAARAGVPVLFVVTPAPDPAVAPDGGAAAQRSAVLAAVPALAGAPWFAVDPAGADPADLRRALVEWAGVTDLRRGADRPPAPATGAVRVVADVPDADWAAWLDRLVRSAAHLARQRLAVELAGIHLRCLRDIVAGAGPAGLPDRFDRELHALSVLATATADAELARIVEETARRLFDRTDRDVRHRLAVAVRRGLADDPAASGLERVLLVTTTAGVATVTGPAAVAALQAYPAPAGPAVLPPFGLALSAGCYGHWRNPANADPARARAWLQRAVRAVELELLAETSRRYGAAGRSLTLVTTEALDHGILLA